MLLSWWVRCVAWNYLSFRTKARDLAGYALRPMLVPSGLSMTVLQPSSAKITTLKRLATPNAKTFTKR